MLIANDMALLTFLPLGYFVLTSTGKTRLMAFTFIMQNIAANLGGMLTPFGNPQNLYLYTYFNIGNLEFMGTMLIPFILSVTLITICCLFVKKEPLTIEDTKTKLPFLKTLIYLLLFALSIIIVFRVIHYLIGLIVILAFLLFMDRRALKKVDYGLLLTFVMFFIFAGNTARIPFVSNALSSLMKVNPLLVPVLSCQVISNVPAALLLSNFTSNGKELLAAVNVAGLGTLIASLASVISYKLYKNFESENPDFAPKKGGYFKIFTLWNIILLLILGVFVYFVL
jgi:Na+/H+ antiporter NhaD/arsenite permease-like protein